MNHQPSRFVRAAVAVAILCVCANSALADGEDARRLTPEQTSVANAAPVKSDIKLDVWLDRSDALYLNGETVTLHLRTDSDAYVTVLNMDAAGVTTVIFPNQYTKENRLAANATAQIPGVGAGWQLKVSPPYGGNLIKVVAKSTPEPVLPTTTLRASGIFSEVVGGGATVVRRLVVTPTTTASPVKWGVASKVFGVVAQRPGTAAVQPAPTAVAQVPVAGAPVAAPAPAVAPAVAASPAPYPVNVSNSAFGLVLEAEKAVFATGERIRLRATAEKSCSLVLLDVLSDGTYSVILPNAAEEDVWLGGGKVEFVTGAGSKHDIVVSGAGAHTLVGICSARRNLGQFLFGATVSRTSAVPKPLSLTEVLDNQPKGDVARTTLVYSVNP